MSSPEHFLDLIQRSKRGKFKIYIGMSAGVGKSYRMLQEAHSLLSNGIDVKIGYIETHNRKETVALLDGLPLIPRRKLFYKGKELEELDFQAVINLRPEVVIVDELAHTNIEGSKNQKRWQDVLDILDAGINVISAVNIQHIESLNEAVKSITGIEVQERIPDSVLKRADEVVNIDLTAEELIDRLKAGKIYDQSKIQTALNNFFKSEQILQLRELALKEVASQVQRKVETEVSVIKNLRKEKILACISSNEMTAKKVIRKAARLANYYNSSWYLLYVQIPKESADKIALDKQRFLINNFKLATELGAEIIKIQSNSVTEAIIAQCEERKITTVCIGKPHLNLWKFLTGTNTLRSLLNKLAKENIDLVILS
ncbi:histidine kinase [Halpernia frigidisoli]|uniref:Two-component system, OmpR family, sensor histidine kinase KdpD n=1 Tax=Halpernia frigidisoli TaxID=1125876 RepID=A0A1I3HQ74_9FLAO|nr:histidine kinase [Halpernia frigidisoli]SFI37773.1 two-component system, OmpR family, sensor histidine kinase KdpD [Halpernia frigidisoli]